MIDYQFLIESIDFVIDYTEFSKDLKVLLLIKLLFFIIMIFIDEKRSQICNYLLIDKIIDKKSIIFQ